MKTIPGTIQLTELINDTSLTGEVKELLHEYGNYMFDELALRAGKESFFKELDNFPTPAYFPPSGTFIVARLGELVAGCVGIKKFNEESFEMKRMFIRQTFRGKGIGRILCNYVIEWCGKSAYKSILLDSNREMKEAVSLYQSCGFVEIPPYCINENDHPLFFQYIL